MSVIRTLAHKEQVRTLRLDNRPAWGCYLVESATGQRMGVRFTWLDGPWTSSPVEHFTCDGGHTYKRVSGSLLPPDLTMGLQIGETETDSERLASLARLMVAYRESLGDPVFSF